MSLIHAASGRDTDRRPEVVALLFRSLPPQLHVAVQPQADGTLLLRASGEIDIRSGPPLAAVVMAVSPSAPGVVLDLADVALVSVSGYRALADAAATLGNNGQRLLLTGCRPRVRHTLERAGAAAMIHIVDTIADAIAGLPSSSDIGDTDMARLRARAAILPGALQTRPVIARAARVVRSRYGVADTDALALLRASSQWYNLKLRTLAAAVLTAKPPRADSPVWFAGRRRHPPPPVTFRTPRREWRDSRSAFLSDVLDDALACMHADAGDLQLTDPILGGLRLELHRGLPAEFTAFFAHVDAGDSACAEALRRGARVVVPDVAASPVFADPIARTTMLAAGAQAVQSTPLLAPQGRCLGMVSTLHPRAGRMPTPAEAATLDTIGMEAGRWLAWHHHTVVLDALEHLHQAARQAG